MGQTPFRYANEKLSQGRRGYLPSEEERLRRVHLSLNHFRVCYQKYSPRSTVQYAQKTQGPVHWSQILKDLWFRRLVLARVHLAAIRVKWPERVPEQTRRVIFFLQRDEALPILAKRGGHARRELVPSEELRVAPQAYEKSYFAP